jgi:hypothetical protein
MINVKQHHKLEKAVQEARRTGEELYFPSGDYPTTGLFLGAEGGAWVAGVRAEPGATLHGKGPGPVIDWTGARDVTVNGLRIRTANPCFAAIAFSREDRNGRMLRARISGLDVDGHFSAAPIYFYGAESNIFDGCILVQRASGPCLWLTATDPLGWSQHTTDRLSTTNNRIRSSLLIRATTAPSERGVLELDGAQATSVYSTLFHSDGGGAGVRAVDQKQNPQLSALSLYAPYFHAAFDPALHLEGFIRQLHVSGPTQIDSSGKSILAEPGSVLLAADINGLRGDVQMHGASLIRGCRIFLGGGQATVGSLSGELYAPGGVVIENAGTSRGVARSDQHVTRFGGW